VLPVVVVVVDGGGFLAEISLDVICSIIFSSFLDAVASLAL